MSKQPHKNSNVIKAWADGEEIEEYDPEKGVWEFVPFPKWSPDSEYRVKPQGVLLDGIPLEAGQTIYYIGSNHNSPRTRIVQEFNLSQVRTLCEKGEDQGYNHLQFFSRKCPKVKYEKKELKPIKQVFMGEKFFYVDFSSDDGARDLRVQYFIPPWVDNLIRRGMCFSTREGAIRKFQKLLSASK